MSWMKRSVLKTSLIRGRNTEKLRQAIDAGKKRLSENKEQVKDIKIVKRKTSEWGEILADFGRK